jgi:hypothetical protein
LSIEDAKNRHEDSLMKLPNVIGVGIGEQDGAPVIEVLVRTKMSGAEPSLIPQSIEGYAVNIVEAGDVISHADERGSDAI